MWPFPQQKAPARSQYDLPMLRTQRLTLRPLTADDADIVYAMIDRNRDEFSRWFTWSRTATPDSIREGLRIASQHMALGTEWHYGIFDSSGLFVGRIGLAEINKRARTGELGYWLGREFAGQGYMTEAGAALMALAMSGGISPRISAYADVDNAASQRVLLKLGFRWMRTVTRAIHHPERGWRNHEHYLLAQEIVDR
jgi:RimJ/RimL family protein N-acetyltransferase